MFGSVPSNEPRNRNLFPKSIRCVRQKLCNGDVCVLNKGMLE